MTSPTEADVIQLIAKWRACMAPDMQSSTTWQSDSTIVPTRAPDQESSTAGLPLELKDKEANDREDIADVVATPNPADRDAFIVWRAKVKSLTADQRREFLSHRHHDLASYVAEFEDIARKQGRRRA